MEYDQLGRRLNQVLRNIVYIVKFNYIRPDSKISRGLGASNSLPLKSTTSSNYEPQLKPDLLGTSSIEIGQNIIQTNDETKDPLAESRLMYSNQSQGSSQMDSKIKSGIRPRKVRLECSRGNPKFFVSLVGSKSSWPRHSFVFISLLVLLASNCMLQIECSESDQSSFEVTGHNIEGVDLKASETHTQSQSAGIDASKSDVQDEPKQVAESTKTKYQEADLTTQSSRSETSVNDTNLAKLAQSESLDEQQSPNTASNTQEQEQVQQQQIDETPVPTVSGLSQSGQELEQNEGWNTKSSGSNDVSSPQTQSEEVQLARQQLQPAEKTNRTKTGEIPSGGTPRSLKRAFGGYLGLFGRKRTPANKPSNENHQGRFFYPGSPTTTTTRVPYQASKTKSLKNADFPDDYREILIQPDYQPTYQQTEQQNNQQQQQQQVEQVIEPQFVPGRQQTGEQSDIQTEQVANLEPGNSEPATPVTEAPTEQIKQETTQPIEQQQELTTEPTPQTTVAQLTSVPYIRLSNIATINSTSGYQNGNSSGNDANGEMKLMRIYVIDLDQKLVVGNGGGKAGEEYATPAIGQLYQAQTSTSAAPKIVENLDSSGQKYMILDRNAFKSAGNFSQLAAQVFAAQQQNYSSSGQTMYTPVLLYQAQTTEAPPEVPRNHQNSSNNYNLASTNEYGDSSSSSPGYNKQPSPQSSYGNQNQNQNQNHQQQQQPNSVPQYIPPQVNQQQSQQQYNGNNNDNWQTRHQQMPANHRAQSDSGYGHNSGTVATGYSQNHADSIPQSQLNPASKAYNDNYHYQANETTNNIDRLRYSLVQGQTGTISYHAPPSPARPYELQQAHLAQLKPGSEYPMAELQQHQASPQDNLYYFAGQAASNSYQHQPVQAQESPLNLYGVGNGNSNKFSTHHQDQHQWKPVDYLAPGSNGAHSSPSAYDSSRPKLSIKSYHESPSGLGLQLQVDEQPQQKDSSSIYQNGDYSQPNNNNNANTMDKTTTDVDHALSLNTDSQHTRSTSQGHKQHSNSAYTNTNQLRPQLESQNLNLNQNDAPSQRGYQNQHYQQHQSDPVADQSDINLPSYNGTSQPNSSSSANFANYQSSSYSTSNEQSAYKQTNKQQPESQHSYGTRAQNSKQSGYASMEQNAPSKSPQKSNQRQPNLSPSYQTTLATTSEVDQSYEAPKIPGPASQRQPYRQQTSYSGDSSDSYLNQDNGELELDTIEPLLQHPRPAYKAPKQNKHHARRRPIPMEPQMVLHDSGIPDSNYPARPQSIPHLGLAGPPPQGLLSSSPPISYGPRPGHQGGRSFLSWETISSVASGAAKRLPNLFMQVVGGTGPNYHHHAPSDPHSMKSVHFIGDVSAFHRPYPLRHMATHGNAPVYHRTRPKTHPKHPIEESPVTQEYEAQMQTSSNTEALKAPVEQLSEAASAGKSNHSALVAGTDTPIEPIELTNVEVVPPKSPSKTAKYVESVVTSSELDPDQVAVLSAADNSKPERPKPRRPKKPRGRRVKRPKLPLNPQIMDSLPEAESDSELSEPQESPMGLVHPGQAPALMAAPMQDEQDIRGSGFRGKLVEGLADPFRSVQIGQYKLTPQTQFVQSIIEPSRQMIGQYLKQYIGHWNQLTG